MVIQLYSIQGTSTYGGGCGIVECQCSFPTPPLSSLSSSLAIHAFQQKFSASFPLSLFRGPCTWFEPRHSIAESSSDVVFLGAASTVENEEERLPGMVFATQKFLTKKISFGKLGRANVYPASRCVWLHWMFPHIPLQFHTTKYSFNAAFQPSWMTSHLFAKLQKRPKVPTSGPPALLVPVFFSA